MFLMFILNSVPMVLVVATVSEEMLSIKSNQTAPVVTQKILEEAGFLYKI